MKLREKDISQLAPGDYEVEFLREQKRLVGVGSGPDRKVASEMADEQFKLTCCILRVVATGEEVDDTSRTTAGSAAGTRFIATVIGGERYASFKPV